MMRRSLAMLTPGANASLSREEAMRLITEVAEARLEPLRLGLHELVEQGGRRTARHTDNFPPSQPPPASFRPLASRAPPSEAFVLDRVRSPLAGHALQRMHATVGERDAGPHHDVFYGL